MSEQMKMELDTKAEPKKAEKKENAEATELATVNASTMLANPFGSKEQFNELYVMAQNMAKSDLVPQNYQGNIANIMLAIDTSNRMGVSPLFVMEQMSIVRGKRSWSGQACATLVNNYPKFKNVQLHYVGKEGTDEWGAYVTAVRKDTGEEIKGTTVTMKMAKGEGWTDNKKWINMPEQMLGYRAYTFFARLHCADALNGFMTEGEVEDAFGESGKKEIPSYA